eukprot:CAMPEP_0182434096 /NCGR_PEP_ID=MMETSP1167-20130531/67669_1 /TAXON_ID=2988 /ORGANISM="Mallomonas Sp, Strain CCMP3275" /LENGTH=435 /DNA_ID=CAMNT_0024623573 /DNA_START=44 /DNA_END=1351 /DNA_ORIENTATION=+
MTIDEDSLDDITGARLLDLNQEIDEDKGVLGMSHTTFHSHHTLLMSVLALAAAAVIIAIVVMPKSSGLTTKGTESYEYNRLRLQEDARSTDLSLSKSVRRGGKEAWNEEVHVNGFEPGLAPPPSFQFRSNMAPNRCLSHLEPAAEMDRVQNCGLNTKPLGHDPVMAASSNSSSYSTPSSDNSFVRGNRTSPYNTAANTPMSNNCAWSDSRQQINMNSVGTPHFQMDAGSVRTYQQNMTHPSQSSLGRRQEADMYGNRIEHSSGTPISSGVPSPIVRKIGPNYSISTNSDSVSQQYTKPSQDVQRNAIRKVCRPPAHEAADMMDSTVRSDLTDYTRINGNQIEFVNQYNNAHRRGSEHGGMPNYEKCNVNSGVSMRNEGPIVPPVRMEPGLPPGQARPVKHPKGESGVNNQRVHRTGPDALVTPIREEFLGAPSWL